MRRPVPALFLLVLLLSAVAAAAPFDVRTFRPWPGYKVNAGTWLQGDFDGDGRSDLFHAPGGDYVHVWFSRGAGTYDVRVFTPWPGYDVTTGPMLAGDFTGDGKTDVLHAVRSSDYANVWRSNGDGTFTITQFSPWSGYGMGGSMIVGDLDSDHRADVVHLIDSADYVQLWRSDGKGGFTVSPFRPWSGYKIGSGTFYAADIEGDGLLDLVHAVAGADYANVWHSDGSGTKFTITQFQPWSGYKIDNGPLVVGWVGKSEIVHTPGGGADYVHPWIPNGDGTFRVDAVTPYAGYPVSKGTWLPGNLDRDGDFDLVHTLSGTDTVAVWVSRADGTYAITIYSPWAGYDVDNGPWLSGDTDGDGRTDLIHLVDSDYIHVWLSTAPGPGEMSLDGLEVTQTVQNLPNAVRLIAGKNTTVRAYPAINAAAPLAVRGLLTATLPDGSPATLASSNAVTVDPMKNGDVAYKRTGLGNSLNFTLPPRWTTPGTLKATVSFTRAVDQVPVPCSNCPVTGVAVPFVNEPPLRVRAIGIEYRSGATPFVPAIIDYDNLQSWLGRAYPTADVSMTQGVLGTTLTSTMFGCGDVNALLAAARGNEVSMGMDPRTHYYGLVADTGFFMRGCAGIPDTCDPGVVGSGPTGPSGYAWDTDGSYGDWYGGHEIAHTFGRMHPAKGCGESDDDTLFPYPDGQISDNDLAYFGFDAGGGAFVPASLEGNVWHDVMTYCDFQWISRYTYEGIRTRLRCENGLPPFSPLRPTSAPAALSIVTGRDAAPEGVVGARSAPTKRQTGKRPARVVTALAAAPPAPAPAQKPVEVKPAGPRPHVERAEAVEMEASFDAAAAPAPAIRDGDLLQVVAKINLTRGTGAIAYTNRVTRAGALAEPRENRAGVRFLDRDGKTLADYVVAIHPLSDRKPGEDQLAILDATLPFHPGTTAVQILLGGNVVDTLRAAPGRPRVGGLARAGQRTIRWSASDPDGDPLTYTVAISLDEGKIWSTIATGLRTASLELPARSLGEARSAVVRVIASDGINKGETTERLDFGGR